MTKENSTRVLLTTTTPSEDGAFERLLAWHGASTNTAVHLVDDPEEAEIILFAESWGTESTMQGVRKHALRRKYREKTFCTSDLDNIVPFIPGVYPSIPRKFYHPGRVRTGPYISMYFNPYVGATESWPLKYLFSFVGDATTHPIRREIFKIRHPRAFFQDTSSASEQARWTGTEHHRASFQQSYADVLLQSKFVLCPAGYSPSTVRVFEVMTSGRVPVIISDEWVPPVGPDWDACAIHLPEADLAHAGSKLEVFESRAAEMGYKARRTWETWFSPDVMLDRIVGWCLDIRRSRSRRDIYSALPAYRQMLHEPYRSNALRPYKHLFPERLLSVGLHLRNRLNHPARKDDAENG